MLKHWFYLWLYLMHSCSHVYSYPKISCCQMFYFYFGQSRNWTLTYTSCFYYYLVFTSWEKLFLFPTESLHSPLKFLTCSTFRMFRIIRVAKLKFKLLQCTHTGSVSIETGWLLLQIFEKLALFSCFGKVKLRIPYLAKDWFEELNAQSRVCFWL